MRRTIEVLGLQGNGAIGEVTAQPSVAFDVIGYNLYDEDGAAQASDVTRLREFLNTEAVRDYLGSDQDMMNQLDRLPAFNSGTLGAPDTFAVPNEMLGMKQVDRTYSTTRNCLSPDKETKAAITQLKVAWIQGIAETWRFFIEADDATDGGPGGITRFQRASAQNPAGTLGEMDLSKWLTFGSPQKRFFRRGFFTLAAGAFTGGDAFIQRGKDNGFIYQRTKSMNDRMVERANVRVLPASLSAATGFVIDTTETGISEMFDTMRPATAQEASAGGQGQSGVAVMDGVAVVPENTFAIRFSPTVASTLTWLAETVGRL